MHIHVGHNMPGYLPESDVYCTDDVTSAVEYLRQELRDQQDYYFEGCTATSPEQQEKGSECCAWCDVANDVEAALSAIADGDVRHWLSTGQPVSWIFNPPEGASMHHWANLPHGARSACEISEDDD